MVQFDLSSHCIKKEKVWNKGVKKKMVGPILINVSLEVNMPSVFLRKRSNGAYQVSNKQTPIESLHWRCSKCEDKE